jgi:hypothetical protein
MRRSHEPGEAKSQMVNSGRFRAGEWTPHARALPFDSDSVGHCCFRRDCDYRAQASGAFHRGQFAGGRSVQIHKAETSSVLPLVAGIQLEIFKLRNYPIPPDSRATAPNAINTPLYSPDHAQPETGCSSAWPEHCVRDAGVAGSNPVTPIFSVNLLRKSAPVVILNEASNASGLKDLGQLHASEAGSGFVTAQRSSI